MRRSCFVSALSSLSAPLAAQAAAAAAPGLRFAITFPTAKSAVPLDGRVLLMLSTDSTAEPRKQSSDIYETQLIFGRDVAGWVGGRIATMDTQAVGYPIESLRDVPAGRYWVQALLNRYETFRRADGHVIKLPPDRGEGQQWNRKPGNLYSTPRWISYGARAGFLGAVPPRRVQPDPTAGGVAVLSGLDRARIPTRPVGGNPAPDSILR